MALKQKISCMENFDEKIKLVKEGEEVQLKLYSQSSAAYLGLWLTSCGVDFRYICVQTGDDYFYDPHAIEHEHLFWIKKDDWNSWGTT